MDPPALEANDAPTAPGGGNGQPAPFPIAPGAVPAGRGAGLADPTFPVPPGFPAPAQQPVNEAPFSTNTLPEVSLAKGDIRLNFQGASLDTVLDYLSRATGYAVIKEASITGTVDVVSHNPLSPDEAVELLNTILGTKNLAAIRTDRTLRIVTRDQAKTHDLPVIQGADPEEIPKTENMVTQIIPVRYADASKLLQNLQPMLATYTSLSANQSSNAIVITDTQTNIRRIASIVKALDTSISMITEVRVFPLLYADAEELATVINKVFEEQASGSSSNTNGARNRMEMFMRMRGGGPPGSGEEQASGSSEAKQAANRIKVVGDPHSNCLVVGAPTEMLETVADLVKQVDIPGEDTAVIRVFPLKYADATSVAESLTSLMSTTTTSDEQRNTRFGRFGGGPFSATGGSQNESRSLKAIDFKAVADLRTNAIIVSASQQTLTMIETVVRDLDATPKNVPQVYVHKIEHADLEKLQEILEGMFEDIDTTSSGTQTNPGSTNVTGALSTRNTSNTTGGR